jgi:hypothetical protein
MAEASPAKQVASFIAKFDPAVAKLARESRSALRKRDADGRGSGLRQLQRVAIGFAPTHRTSDCIVSLAVYARGVNLYFIHGRTLPDPNGILLGKGNQGRFVRLAKGVDLDKPEPSSSRFSAKQRLRRARYEPRRWRLISFHPSSRRLISFSKPLSVGR